MATCELEWNVNARDMQAVIKVLDALVDEAKLVFDTNGMHIRTVDDAHVAMVQIEIEPAFFEKLNVSDTETIGVDITKMKEILKLCNTTKEKADIIKFRLDTDINRLVYQVGYNEGKISLVDTTGMSEPRPPELKLPAKFTIKTNDLVKILKRADCLSEHVSIEIEDDMVIIRAEGATDTATAKLTENNEALICVEGENCKSVFSLHYLSDMIKAAKGQAEEISFNIGTNYPIKITYKIGQDDAGKVTYLLAPRVEND